MNENLNLVEIFKDCPNGTKLYSSVFGEVELDHIDTSANYPIIIRLKGEEGHESITSEGKMFADYDGECVLFPSREERDWSKFKPTYKFKDGDILSYQNARLSNRTIYIYRHHKGFNTSYYVALSFDPKKSLMICDKGGLALNGYNETVRFATEEEKQKLFKAIKDNGYEWNAETKTLKKLVKPKFKVGDKLVNIVNMYMGDLSHQCVISEITNDKYILNDGGYIHFKNQDIWELVNDNKQRFDPKTLQPFDKVLARDTENSTWRGTLFSHYNKDDGVSYPCVTVGEVFSVCIPYNEDTKRLLGTSDEAPEYYRYWED